MIQNIEADKNFLLMPWTSSVQRRLSAPLPFVFVQCLGVEVGGRTLQSSLLQPKFKEMEGEG